MKIKIKFFFHFVLFSACRFWAILFSYSTVNKWQRFKTKLHTYWISSEFKIIGKLTTIDYPINLRGGKYISIGNGVGIGKRSILTAWDSYRGGEFAPEIKIGNNTSIGEDSHITSINKIDIGDNVLMGKKITITDNSHGKAESEMLHMTPIERPLFSKGPVIIEDNVWIGDKVTILPDVTIGKNSIIGANSLVTKSIPSNCVAGGVPARVIKQLI